MKRLKIIFLGTNGFPFGMAAVEKQKLIAKALNQKIDVEVEIICNNSLSNKKIPIKGLHEGIKYRYTCLYTKRRKNRILNRINRLFGRINELLILLYCKYNVAIVSSRNFNTLFLYYIILKLRNKKFILTAVEDKNIMPSSSTIMGKIDNFFYQKYIWKMVDGALPISEELKRQISKSNPFLPQLKVPAIVDLTLFQKEYVNPMKDNYLLFCGAATYFDTIKLIVDSFVMASVNTKLVLVINGNKNEIEEVKNYLIKQDSTNIIIKSDLSYSDLVAHYKYALALLIPLNFTQQDKARFPHKIGEYCASGRPIISSDWGEVNYYFKNMQSAYLSNKNDLEEWSNLYNCVIRDSLERENIAKKSYMIGEKYFSYLIYANKIYKFINSL